MGPLSLFSNSLVPRSGKAFLRKPLEKSRNHS
jgi:hypothetical protein